MISLPIHPSLLPGPLQAAAVLIQAGRLPEAHRLLLQHTRKSVRNPHLWLLLAWSAPSPSAARAYYHLCVRLDPSNELAQAALAAPTFADPCTKAIHPSRSVDEPLVARTSPDYGDPVFMLAGRARSPSTGYAPQPQPSGPTQRAGHLVTCSDIRRHELGAAGATVETTPFSLRLFHLGERHFRWLMLFYLLLLALAELLTTFSAPQLGVGLHALLLVLLFVHASTARVHAQQCFLYTVALAPLIRIVSLSMPLTSFQYSYWYAIIGLPLLLSAYLVLRLTRYRPVEVGLTLRSLPLQLSLGLLGFPLGWLEYQILHPAPLVQSWRLPQVLLTALILLIFTGFLEEFIFRGLMQRAADNIMRMYGPYWISLLFAVLHIGYRSFLDFFFVLLVGLLFAFIVKRTQSIIGVTLAHGLTNISLYIILALLLR